MFEKSEKKCAFSDVRSELMKAESAKFPVISLFIREFIGERGSIETVSSTIQSIGVGTF
jgi:hypothetical protein